MGATRCDARIALCSFPPTGRLTVNQAPARRAGFAVVDPRHDPIRRRPSGAIGAPAIRALTAAGYTRLGQLAGVPVDELKRLHGVGPKALRLLQAALEEEGKTLG